MRQEITGLGWHALVFETDLSNPAQAENLITFINQPTLLQGLVNSAGSSSRFPADDIWYKQNQSDIDVGYTQIEKGAQLWTK